jgi:hypothetical protein
MRVKYDAEVSYERRCQFYNSMILSLALLSGCEATYKMTVDEANSSVSDFRR